MDGILVFGVQIDNFFAASSSDISIDDHSLDYVFGLKKKFDFYLNPFGRGAVATIYYAILAKVPFLKYFLPSCANVILTSK